MNNDLRESNEFKMFWIIETGNLDDLILFCKELKKENKHVNMYWPHDMVNSIFTKEECTYMRVQFSGVLDFSPVQHACAIGFDDAVLILLHYNISLIQGSGLPTVNLEKFITYYTSLCQMRIKMATDLRNEKN
jgi:hypothetical protein